MYAPSQMNDKGSPELLATDYSVACMLELARLANVEFDVAEDRLVMRAAKINWDVWPSVRSHLDEIGADALKSYVQRAHGATALGA